MKIQKEKKIKNREIAKNKAKFRKRKQIMQKWSKVRKFTSGVVAKTAKQHKTNKIRKTK